MSMHIQLRGTRLIKVVASGKEETQTTYYSGDLTADSDCRHLVMAEQKARGFTAALEVYLRHEGSRSGWRSSCVST